MEALFLFFSVIFAVVMIFMLPKYARFIHEQPKKHMEQRLAQEKKEEQKEPPAEPEDPSGRDR